MMGLDLVPMVPWNNLRILLRLEINVVIFLAP
jgi:hypothetical protein